VDDQIDLPDSIKAAWGQRERPRKGPRPELSLDRIVEAAIQVATSSGLAAVSMSRVAAELGAATMSLYRYVAAKDELLALMADAAIGMPPPPVAEGEGWRAGLSRWAQAERAVLGRHPWVLRIPISGPPITPRKVAWLEVGLGCLRATPLAETEKLSIVLLLDGYVRASATLAADLNAAFETSGIATQHVSSAYGRLLANLTDAPNFPALHAVIAAGVFDEPDDPDSEFLFGLERVLDGIEALVRRALPTSR
jgi:AcrR family transcriptional regulator